MPSFPLPPLPAQTSLEVLEVGAAPLVRRFIEALDLPGLFDRHLPRLRGRQPEPPTSTVLCLLLSNLLLAREPLYGLSAWASSFVPEYLGLLPGQHTLFNDDRCGRAADHLYRADRASLLTAVILRVIRVFRLGLAQLHQDTTTVTFSGDYADQPAVDVPNRPARIRRGYNKDHRPDLKQLVYERTITSDGAVPIHCKIHDGNTSDDSVHRSTWQDLRQLVGHSDFLYVADSKLCTKDNMSTIANEGGRFLTVMPRTRMEDERFRARILTGPIAWQEVWRRPSPRGKDKPEVVYKGFEEEQGSVEGYRLFWYLSSQKQQRDKAARHKKLVRTRRQLQRLRPRGRGTAFTSEQAAREATQRVLSKAGVQDWLSVRIVEEVWIDHVQAGPGRPGPDTLYKQVQTKTYKIGVENNDTALKQAEQCDGLFPLMTNDKTLSVAEALAKYKYQPYAEKRHEQLKSVFGVRPMWLKSAKRVESLLWLYHLVEVIQALVEREVRLHMKDAKVASLPLYHEKRRSAAPTTEIVLRMFHGHRRYRMLDAQAQVLQAFHDPLPQPAAQVLDFLRVDRAAYGLPPRSQG